MSEASQNVARSGANAQHSADDAAQGDRKPSQMVPDLDFIERTAQIGSWCWHANEGRSALSVNARRIWGFDIEQISFDMKSFVSAVHPDDLDKMKQVFMHASQTGDYEGAEYRIIRNGEIRRLWNEARCTEFNEDGTVARVMGVSQDVTDLRDAEKRTKEAERVLRTIFDDARHQYMLISVDGEIIEVNKAAQDYAGKSRRELIGSKIWQDSEFFDDSDEEAFLKQSIAAAAQGASLRGVREYHLPGGDSVAFEGSMAPICDDEGNVAYILIEAIDVTDKHEADLKLAESEKRFRLLAENGSDIVCLHEVDGTVLYASPSFEKSLGYAPDEIVGSCLDFLFQPHDLEMTERLIERACMTRETVKFEACSLRSKSGAYRWFEILIHPILDENGVCVQYASSSRDITDRTLVESQLRQAQKVEALGNLVGGIAHDINNSLTPVLNMLQLVMRGMAEDSKDLNRLDLAMKGARRVEGLVQKILTYGRHDSSERSLLQISHVVQDFADLFRATLPPKIAFNVWVDPADTHIYGDETQLHQVLMNLATNAQDAIRDESGEISLTVDTVTLPSNQVSVGRELQAGDYCRIRMRDSGFGISEIVRERIFDPFYTTKDVGEGTGLGLSVVHSIVGAHRGAIGVTNIQGAGAEFCVLLPAETDLATLAAISAEKVASGMTVQ